jgi:hypothetical protein
MGECPHSAYTQLPGIAQTQAGQEMLADALQAQAGGKPSIPDSVQLSDLDEGRHYVARALTQPRRFRALAQSGGLHALDPQGPPGDVR